MESYLRNFLFRLLVKLFLENKCNETANRLLDRYFELFDDEAGDFFANMSPEAVQEMETRILAKIHEIIDRLD
ncbi:hypothetical protein [Pedobacter sp. MR2016-24]|uniref:hypothetical protein n=1 Tax=Pedobacter sp. MR2016-24 TaxID=2994466 RepID=UPI002246CCAD|nr:hypothetical protein [Pedobacter sp. MR2016-24]MCX2485528.1 hypothetical protein [Pedobacter sp. MR2016-24]